MTRINPHVRRLRCSLTGTIQEGADFARPVGLCSCCPAPGKPVVVEYDLDGVRSTLGGGPTGRGLRRWEPLLPVNGLDDAFAGDVGGTPVLEHARLGAEAGCRVLLKNEGTNPSGSFKDRGLAVAVALGAEAGARRFCLPTQGNAGVAASMFSARAGLPGCLVYMPEGYQGSIYHRACELFGGEVRFAGANIAAAGAAMRDDARAPLASGEYVELSTFFEPGRLEGKKTMGLEIFDHFGADALPDVIVYPTGGGTGLVGIWKAFTELAEIGLIDPERHRLPRMVAVQSERCAPVVFSFRRGLGHVESVESQGTIADGLDVPGAIMGHAILSVLADSRGTAVAVSEDEILAAFHFYGRLGVDAGYESAATFAALRQLVAAGHVQPDDRVLLLNTGSQLIPLARGA